VDSKSDGSTLWRDLENFNLIMTLRGNPFWGRVRPRVRRDHHHARRPVRAREIRPSQQHSRTLGVRGLFRLHGDDTALGGRVYFAMRSYRMAKEAEWRAAALVSSGAVLIYLIQCWGDMGLGTWTGVWIVAPSIAVAGKLAVATGAWPSKQKASVAVPSKSRRPDRQVAATSAPRLRVCRCVTEPARTPYAPDSAPQSWPLLWLARSRRSLPAFIAPAPATPARRGPAEKSYAAAHAHFSYAVSRVACNY